MEIFGWNPVGTPQSLHQRIGGFILNVEKKYAGSLQNESLNDGLTDSGGSTGDESNLPFEAALHSGG